MLSILVPGLGHVYAGEAKWGVQFYGLLLVAGVASLATMLWLPLAPFNVVTPTLIMFLLYVYVVAHSVRAAKRQRHPDGLKTYQRWYLYVLAIAVSWFVVAPVMRHTTRSITQAFTIPSGSMMDNVLVGDYILVSKAAYGIYNPFTNRRLVSLGAVRRHDVIVYKSPRAEQRYLIHRVIGLPGDRLEIRQHQVYVNGQVLPEPDVKRKGEPGVKNENFGPALVPAGHFFVMGDNRDSSIDSRYWGFLPEANVIGRATRIYWSWDTPTQQVRWARIGGAID